MLHIYHKSVIPAAFEGMLDAKQLLQPDDNTFFVFDCYQDDANAALSFIDKWKERKWLKRSIPQAYKIVVFSEFTAGQLRKYYPKIASNISIQFPRIEEIFHPIDDDAKDAVRYRETNGDAYFIYRGPIHPAAELKNLLKGFSIFKKKMGSNMKLVLCGSVSSKSEAFLAELDTYKYKEDVMIKTDFNQTEESELIAAAYALVHPCRWERFGFSPLKAMKTGVAVLTVENSSMSEFTSMAGMYFNEKDPSDIGEKMMRIYKDEQMRMDMIGTGLSKGL
ncbi:MAG: glycosyltransferase [Chitinophagaceae bacterium]